MGEDICLLRYRDGVGGGGGDLKSKGWIPRLNLCFKNISPFRGKGEEWRARARGGGGADGRPFFSWFGGCNAFGTDGAHAGKEAIPFTFASEEARLGWACVAACRAVVGADGMGGGGCPGQSLTTDVGAAK